MPDFDNNGATIHYEFAGSGPPVLMLAGIASDSASWGPLTPLLTPLLAQRYRLILIDNRGSGRSRTDGDIALADMAGDAIALLDRLDIAEASIVSHSLGGALGLMLAASHPARVRRLVTMTAGALTPKLKTLFDDLQRLYHKVPPQDFFRLLYQWLFSEPFFADPVNVSAAAIASAAYPHRQSPEDFTRQVAALGTAPRFDRTAISCPVLALAGSRDLIGPPAAVASLHATIPDHRLEILDGAHSLHWEAPEEVARLIINFLN